MATAGALMTTVLLASQAAAATNDSFSGYTTDDCGAVDFVDYGEGRPGGGKNDDYLVIHDYCADSHGVWVSASVDGFRVGTEYNGNGFAGPPVIWDPFGNVLPANGSSCTCASSMARTIRRDSGAALPSIRASTAEDLASLSVGVVPAHPG